MVISIENFGYQVFGSRMQLQGIKLSQKLISLDVRAFPGSLPGSDVEDKCAGLQTVLLVKKMFFTFFLSF